MGWTKQTLRTHPYEIIKCLFWLSFSYVNIRHSNRHNKILYLKLYTLGVPYLPYLSGVVTELFLRCVLKFAVHTEFLIAQGSSFKRRNINLQTRLLNNNLRRYTCKIILGLVVERLSFTPVYDDTKINSWWRILLDWIDKPYNHQLSRCR